MGNMNLNFFYFLRTVVLLFVIVIVIAIVIIISYLLFLAIKSMNLHMNIMEGLTNESSTSISNSINGEGSSADNYITTIKNQIKNITDNLSISKNKQKYESIVINMDDYINAMMLKIMLNIDIDTKKMENKSFMQEFKELNELNATKKSLDSIMKYLDSA